MGKTTMTMGAAIGGWNLGIMVGSNFEFFVIPTPLFGFITGAVVWVIGVVLYISFE
jgi:hypothetical protein